MRGFKPDKAIWERVNQAFIGENAADVVTTLISGLSMIIVSTGAAEDELSARIHLAAMLLSPDLPGVEPGSLLPRLQAEFAKLNDGKWIQ